jgi:hypothetical protein
MGQGQAGAGHCAIRVLENAHLALKLTASGSSWLTTD